MSGSMLLVSPYRVGKVLASTVALSFVLGCGGEVTPAPENSVASIVDEPNVLVFDEAVSPEDWDSQSIDWPNLKRLEFLADDQPMLDFSRLEGAQELERFRFDGDFDRRQLPLLSNCSKLRILNTQSANLTPEDVALLGTFADLESLRLGSASLDGSILAGLADRWPHLTHLHLIRVPIADESLEALHGIDQVHSLYLDAISVSEDALRSLLEARPDIHLHINQLHLDGDAQADGH